MGCVADLLLGPFQEVAEQQALIWERLGAGAQGLHEEPFREPKG